MSRTKMATCLWYDFGQARKAAEFYASVFPDSSVGAAFTTPADYPGGAAGGEVRERLVNSIRYGDKNQREASPFPSLFSQRETFSFLAQRGTCCKRD
jgi:predicted 3-demethylubiquinone-9 3-methyltransferase (glyoxalase superfamily)